MTLSPPSDVGSSSVSSVTVGQLSTLRTGLLAQKEQMWSM